MEPKASNGQRVGSNRVDACCYVGSAIAVRRTFRDNVAVHFEHKAEIGVAGPVELSSAFSGSSLELV